MAPDMKHYRVLVTPTTFGQNDSRLRSELEASVGEVVYNRLGRPLVSREVREMLGEIDGYIAGLDEIDSEALEGADRLKVVARYGVGVDNVDLEAAARRSIVVTNTPHANSVSVAELTVGLMVSLARSIPGNSAGVLSGGWPRNGGFTLQGKTIGILGFGSIGREVARRLRGWGCRVVAYDPIPCDKVARELEVELRPLEDVLERADILSLHLPALAETRGMVNAAFLGKMKKGAFLINAARGELVDEAALAEALRSGRLRGAALDALHQEPPSPDHPLLLLPQVIITPHCGAHTDGAMDAMGWESLRDCLAVLMGEEPAHPVLCARELLRCRIRTQPRPTMYFIGVSTGKSSIRRAFPLWMKELGRPEVYLEGVDLKLHDHADNYRRVVAQIKYDAQSLGALVTTHKIHLLEAARDMFDNLDPFALASGEVSSISKNGRALEGHAKDPITAGMSLDCLLSKDYFRCGADVLCLGAGGSATAIVLHFASKESSGDRPGRMIIVDCSPGPLEKLRVKARDLKTDIEFEYHCNIQAEINDRLMAKLTPGSLVINATGMGKDLPGSPITGNGVFPVNGIAWELNYRGKLAFLRQALTQAEPRRLVVEDGWLYFLHGWTQVIAQVLKVRIEAGLFERLASIAGSVCAPVLPHRVVPRESRTNDEMGAGSKP